MTRARGMTVYAAGGCALIAIVGGVSFFAACSGLGPAIARKGKSPYAIVLSSNPSLSERHAADEFRSHIALATGAELPVVPETNPRAAKPPRIFVGFGEAATKALAGTTPVAPDSLGDEGFIIRSLGSIVQPDYVIAGGRLRGTMYGVYTFLDRLGFRWYTANITRFPESGMVPVVNMNETTVPVFMYREPYIAEAFDGDWAARNRVNSGTADLDSTRGGKVRWLGVHTFDLLMPTSLYKDHPEYFPLIGGKRVTGYVQRCLTNPDLVDIAADNLNAWMDSEPSVHIFALAQNDAEQYCECPACKKIMEEEGSPAGLYISFVNKVAEKVEQKHPENYVSTLAYTFTEKPPKTVRPRENVIVQLCPIYMCDSHPFTECSKPETKQFAETLAGWSRLTDHIFVWHYSADVSSYLAPFPNFRNFTFAINKYSKSGVKGIFLLGANMSKGSSYSELRAWVMARMLWYPDADPDSLVNEWMQAIYGPAFPQMRAAFDYEYAQFTAPDRHLWIFDMPTKERWHPAVIASLDSIYGEAEKSAAPDSTALLHIRKEHLSTRYVQLFQNSGTLEINNDAYRPTGNTLTIDDYNRFLADMGTFGITYLAEEPYNSNIVTLLRQRYETHPMTTIENADLRLDIVPDLGGRIVAITLKKTGERIIGRTDRDNFFYPASGGYEEATTRTWGCTGFSNPYTAEVKGRLVTLTGQGINGLEFRRVISLPERGTRISIASTLTNNGRGPTVARLVCRMELASAPDSSRVNAGSGEEPAADFRRDGANKPRGTWSVTNTSGGWRMENRFPADKVESCNLVCNSKAGTVLMEDQGFEQDIAPGKSTGLVQTWEIMQDR